MPARIFNTPLCKILWHITWKTHEGQGVQAELLNEQSKSINQKYCESFNKKSLEYHMHPTARPENQSENRETPHGLETADSSAYPIKNIGRFVKMKSIQLPDFWMIWAGPLTNYFIPLNIYIYSSKEIKETKNLVLFLITNNI